ncbi:MAG: hypothetical protein MI867_13030 [Pseudomonadales bacterium]|nr:hypothetical protein [Pseudomonadales bacterium]
MVTHGLRITLLSLLLCVAGLAHSNDTAKDLRHLHNVQLDLLEVASQFHRFQGSEGNKKYYLSITSKLDDLRNALSESEAALNRYTLAPEAQAIKDNSQLYLQNLNTALSSIRNGGFADFSVIDAYLSANDAMLKSLKQGYTAIASTGSYKVPPLVIALRDQTLLMQRMYAKYIEVSASQFGYTPRTDQENVETLDQLAARFSNDLEKLKANIPVNSPYASRISDVKTKWLFLEKSFLNYNEKTVPYLITKFGKQIISELSGIADDMESTS